MKHALVSGASGFIGATLVAALRAANWRVTALLREPRNGGWDDWLRCDLHGTTKLELPAADVLFHLAGKAHALDETRQQRNEYFQINTQGTRRLLEACQAAGVRRCVFFSSVKAMGEGGAEAQDETGRCEPETPYGQSKLEAERLLLEGGYVPEPVVLRLSMVYGPTLKGNLPRMIEAVANGRFPPLPETGNRRSMLHVQDVAAAALLAAEQSRAVGQIYILTDGRSYSTRQILDCIYDVLARPRPGWAVPFWVLKVLAGIGDLSGALRNRRVAFDSDSLAKLLGSAHYSSRKIERELGFRPQHDLYSALPEIVAFLGLK